MSAAGRRRATPNPSGAHALADHAAQRLVRQAQVGPGDLVLDIGAGLGAVTRPLATTGARVIAIERDERIGAKLQRRMAAVGNVTVVIDDALAVPLPRRPFRVVASIPYSITTPLLRRLVDSRLTAADLVVEWAAGRRLAGSATGSGRRELAGWHQRFDFVLGQVLPARLFRPAPPVDSVVLRMRRRAPGGRTPGPTGSRTPRSGQGRR